MYVYVCICVHVCIVWVCGCVGRWGGGRCGPHNGKPVILNSHVLGIACTQDLFKKCAKQVSEHIMETGLEQTGT